jgi:hypothetical protein
LSEGEGEAIWSGSWKLAGADVSADYRLVSWYKMLVPESERPRQVPGPIQHAMLKIVKSSVGMGNGWMVEFDGKKYVATSGFRTSELRLHLQLHEQSPTG